MSFLKKILSYFYPQTEFVDSQHSGKIEITWYRGKKMLDTQNANYSYGSLQEVLEFGIAQVDLSSVNSILILGMGAGSVIQSLRDTFNYQKSITAVEFDESIIEIAAAEFGITSSENLKIIHADAEKFLLQHNEAFDLIIIDLFIDNKIPQKFKQKSFFESLEKFLHLNAFMIFNTLNLSKEEIDSIQNGLKKNFSVLTVSPPNHENLLFIAKN